MNLKKLHSEPLLAALSIGLIVLLITTRSASMSAMVQSMMLGLFVAAVFAYSAFIYRERPADEREQEISLAASKHAYLVGAAVLTIGIVIQSANHELDVWLPIALGSMVTIKSLSYFIHNK